ncbi:MAG: CooT family nickel-binding protein [Candidatus Bathyarchaeia archaeon]
MCEFKVFLSGQLVFEDVVYAKLQGSDLVLRDVLGSQKIIPCARIVEVNVSSETLLVEGVST